MYHVPCISAAPAQRRIQVGGYQGGSRSPRKVIADQVLQSPPNGSSMDGLGFRLAASYILTDHTRHTQKSAEADAAAAHRGTIQRVIRKLRQKSRDRDRPFEPRQRHPGALMRAGARRRDAGSACGRTKSSGSGNCRGSRFAAPMHSVTGVPADSVTPPSSTRSVVMRLPSWLELSNRKISSTAVLIRSGCSIRRFFCAGYSIAPPAHCRSGWWWSRARR